MPPVEQYRKYFSSFFVTARFLVNFASRIFHTEKANTSPTSVLHTKPSSCPTTPTSTTEHKCFGDIIDLKGVGLGIVEALLDDKFGSNPESPRILFGCQIKTHTDIPTLLHPSDSLESLAEAETETTDSTGTSESPRIVKVCLPSAREMKLSEDYTRVIFHGPNPRITHIFKNCIVDSSLFDTEFSGSEDRDEFLPHQPVYPSDEFLNFCLYCKKYIGHREDIFMLRGERAFCSTQCRLEGIELVDEEEFLKVAAVKKKDLIRIEAAKESESSS